MASIFTIGGKSSLSNIRPFASQRSRADVFDGQGHRIKNMIIYRPQDEAQGFFGYLQGNAACTVKNLIIDESCSQYQLSKKSFSLQN